jgi:hypothetical protein
MPLPLAYGKQQHIGGQKKFLAANEVMDATCTHMTQGFFFPLFWESVGECWIFVVPNVFPSSPQWVHNMFPITPHYIPYPLPYILVG